MCTLTDGELHDRCTRPDLADDAATPRIVVATPDGSSSVLPPDHLMGLRPWIVISEPRSPEQPTEHLDAIAEPGLVSIEDLIDACKARPFAATALGLLQRGGERREVGDGLIAESATYSMLLASAEFAAWRSTHPPAHRPTSETSPVLIHRAMDRLTIELNHAATRNALSTAMRDALVGALGLGLVDPAIEVYVCGLGPTFCSGGDRDEFGTFGDAAGAHQLRLATSLGAMIDALGERIIFCVHGACRGSGVELPAFARRVSAHPATTFALPELAMGLIPGAGGTVSVTRRIGRLRTTTLALSGAIIDADRALEWGLIDVVDS